MRKRYLFAALAGCAALVLAGTALLGRRHAVAPTRESAEDTRDDAPLPVDRRQSAATVDRARLANLEARVAALTAPAEAPPAPETKMPGPEERARRIAEEYQYHQGLLSANAGSPRNARWASEMERTIAAGFEKLGNDTSLKYVSADCRSDTCAVNLSWPSRSAAESELGLVMSLLARSMCAREIALPPPGNEGEGAFRASAVLQCAQPAAPS